MIRQARTNVIAAEASTKIMGTMIAMRYPLRNRPNCGAAISSM
jgi:hypothetical protein